MPRITRYTPSVSDENPIIATGGAHSHRGELEAVLSLGDDTKYTVDGSSLTIEDLQGEFATFDLARLGLRPA